MPTVTEGAAVRPDQATAIRVLFLMEQHLGHRTYRDNLRTFLEQNRSMECTWVPVEYAPLDSLLERVPLPGSVRGRLRGRSEVRRALQDGHYDVVFFNTHVPAVLGGALTARTPYVIGTDITPTQYDAIAVEYGRTPRRPGPVAWLRHRQYTNSLRGRICVAAMVLVGRTVVGA